ncbi:ABC transporter permease [Novipirellula artificiosorum]|uniref:ABC-2 family transporter protein n=1 Tax=Novipirellula artificiosorum TaxID=2528016 RepID=A0A5C6E0T3_9BACT|nr:ABC transporter permease [Novipirellula artificiosorum]TWU42518.1 ABC-2 family transporter protein [Novipirellula artificiosorum]
MSEAIVKRTGSSPINSWLVWKEVIQIVPLVASLLVIVAILVTLQYWNNPLRVDGFFATLELTCLILPGIFATGAAAVTVGQEREHRTIDWLSSLPITPKRLILTKIAVALAGLLIMWVIAVSLITLLVGPDPLVSRFRLTNTSEVHSDLTPISFPMWGVHSLLVLSAGFYTAWRFKNQYLSLISLLTIAAIPTVLAWIASELFSSHRHLGLGVEFYAWLILSIVMIPTVFLLGYRRAKIVLSPASANRPHALGRVRSLLTSNEVPVFHSDVSSILWQSIHSSRVLYAILAVMFLVGAGHPTDMLNLLRVRYYVSTFIPLASVAIAVALPVAISWAGVSVFKFAGSADQLRFLADRGVSPTKIYIARHAVPIAMVAASVVLCTILSTIQATSGTQSSRYGESPSLLSLTLSAAGIYAISQWVSQLIRTTTVAALVAPAVSFVMYPSTWYWYDLDNRWQVLLRLFAAAIPMLATWWLMQRYMDRRDFLRKILLAVLVVFFTASTSFAARLLWERDLFGEQFGVEGDARSMHMKWLMEQKQQPRPNPVLVPIDSNLFDDVEWFYSDESKVQLASELIEAKRIRPMDLLTNLDQLQSDSTSAAAIDSNAWRGWLVWLMFEQVRFDAAMDDADDAQADDAFESLLPWIDSTSLLVSTLRRSPRWLDQEVADRFEIWLAQSLTRPTTAPFLNRDMVRVAIARLPTIAARNEARRHAIRATRESWPDGPGDRLDPAVFGGVEVLSHKSTELGIRVSYDPKYQLDRMAVAALEAVRLSDQKIYSTDPNRKLLWWERQMHEATVSSLVPPAIGPYSPRYRSLPERMTLIAHVGYQPQKLYPAQFFAMPWESVVEGMKKQR